MNNSNNDVGFWDHISELRKRIILSLCFFIVVFIAIWFIRNDLLNVYLFPLAELVKQASGEIILLTITDKFFIHLRTTLFFSIIFSLPFTVFQLWRFIVPGLYEKEKSIIRLLLFLVVVQFYIGISVSYLFVIPFGFDFLVNYSVNQAGVFQNLLATTKLSISLIEQVNLTQKFVLVFGFVFQLPLVMALVTRLGVIDIKTFSKYRKHAIILCFASSAMLTPPDPLTMIGLGLPLVILYEVGLIFSRIINR